MAPQKNSHCSYCGEPFGEGRPWPRDCGRCGRVSYLNPLPVAVLLLPAGGGLVCVRRDIEPGRGKLALPGGFIDVGETWQQAAARELFEEAGIRVAAAEVRLFDLLSSTQDGVLLVFGLAPELPPAGLPAFRPTDETSELVILKEPAELAFSLHTQVVREFFRRGG